MEKINESPSISNLNGDNDGSVDWEDFILKSGIIFVNLTFIYRRYNTLFMFILI